LLRSIGSDQVEDVGGAGTGADVTTVTVVMNGMAKIDPILSSASSPEFFKELAKAPELTEFAIAVDIAELRALASLNLSSRTIEMVYKTSLAAPF